MKAARLNGWSDLVAQMTGLPPCVKELRIIPARKFATDICYPEKKLAVEIEGGAWTRGRHTRGAGFLRDMEKYNLLTELGWRLLRYSPDKINYAQILKVWMLPCGESQ